MLSYYYVSFPSIFFVFQVYKLVQYLICQARYFSLLSQHVSASTGQIVRLLIDQEVLQPHFSSLDKHLEIITGKCWPISITIRERNLIFIIKIKACSNNISLGHDLRSKNCIKIRLNWIESKQSETHIKQAQLLHSPCPFSEEFLTAF